MCTVLVNFDRFGLARMQVRHHEWVFGPNYGMVDISLKDEGRPDVTSELF